MNNKDPIYKVSDILDSFFPDLLRNKIQEKNNLNENWRKVLLHIPKDGERLVAHSKILEIKNNSLYLETDHPGWIQLFNIYRRQILKALKEEFPALEIRDFSFILKKE
ncbi:MAG: DUF721 domain-containing protein [Spirochaetales bacterium]